MNSNASQSIISESKTDNLSEIKTSEKAGFDNLFNDYLHNFVTFSKYDFGNEILSGNNNLWHFEDRGAVVFDTDITTIGKNHLNCTDLNSIASGSAGSSVIASNIKLPDDEFLLTFGFKFPDDQSGIISPDQMTIQFGFLSRRDTTTYGNNFNGSCVFCYRFNSTTSEFLTTTSLVVDSNESNVDSSLWTDKMDGTGISKINLDLTNGNYGFQHTFGVYFNKGMVKFLLLDDKSRWITLYSEYCLVNTGDNTQSFPRNLHQCIKFRISDNAGAPALFNSLGNGGFTDIQMLCKPSHPILNINSSLWNFKTFRDSVQRTIATATSLNIFSVFLQDEIFSIPYPYINLKNWTGFVSTTTEFLLELRYVDDISNITAGITNTSIDSHVILHSNITALSGSPQSLFAKYSVGGIVSIDFPETWKYIHIRRTDENVNFQRSGLVVFLTNLSAGNVIIEDSSINFFMY